MRVWTCPHLRVGLFYLMGDGMRWDGMEGRRAQTEKVGCIGVGMSGTHHLLSQAWGVSDFGRRRPSGLVHRARVLKKDSRPMG